jgi:hypothetical protein
MNFLLCQQAHCRKNLRAVQKAKAVHQKFFAKKMQEMMLATTKTKKKQIKEEMFAYIDKSARTPRAVEMMKCSVNHCRDELEIATKVMAEAAHVRIKPLSDKATTTDFRDALTSISKKIIEKLEKLEIEQHAALKSRRRR